VKSRISIISAIGFLVLLSLSWTAAQTTPHLTPFSADMQFSSNRGPAAMHDMKGKIYISQQHMRMEMGGGPGGGPIMITDFATKTTDTLMPEQHMYMEFKADQMRHPGMGPNIRPVPDPNNPCAAEPDMTCKNLGVEQVNGRTCQHWQITRKNGEVSNMWIDQKIHFPIKTVSQDSSWELTNIKEGEPAASLFEIPSGYQKMDMGRMMQGMQPQQPPEPQQPPQP
jgi:hypothetical protein